MLGFVWWVEVCRYACVDMSVRLHTREPRLGMSMQWPSFGSPDLHEDVRVYRLRFVVAPSVGPHTGRGSPTVFSGHIQARAGK